MYWIIASAETIVDCKQIDRFLKGSFTDRQGNFNYKEWVKVLRVNEDDDGAEAQT